eukprot:m51a1_g5780 hypothetical protein (410) ;mRNA; f:1260234-1261463
MAARALGAVPAVCEASAHLHSCALVPLASAIVAVMREHSADPAVQSAGCRAVMDLARVSPEALEECVRAGAVQCVLSVLSTASAGADGGDADPRELSCGALVVLCDSPSAMGMAVGALEVLVGLLRAGASTCGGSAVLACNVLAKLSSHGDMRALGRLVESGAAEAVSAFLECAQESTQSVRVCRSSASVLCNIVVRGGDLGRLVVDRGSFRKLLVERCVTQLADPTVVLLCKAIAVVASMRDERYELERVLCVRVLRYLMRRFADEPEVVEEALRALLTLALSDAGNAGALTAALVRPEVRQEIDSAAAGLWKHALIAKLARQCTRTLLTAKNSFRVATLRRRVHAAERKVRELEEASAALQRVRSENEAMVAEIAQLEAELAQYVGVQQLLAALSKSYSDLVHAYYS